MKNEDRKKRATQLLIALAAVGLIAAKQIHGETTAELRDDAQPKIVRAERDAFAELQRIGSTCDVSPTGHITKVDLIGQSDSTAEGRDLSFLAGLGHLQQIDIGPGYVSARGMKVLLRMK